MKFKAPLTVCLSLAALVLSISNRVDATVVPTTDTNQVSTLHKTLILAGTSKSKAPVTTSREHTSNQSPSNKAKHEKGQAAKQNAQINKQFKEAKKKDSKLGKYSFQRSQKSK